MNAQDHHAAFQLPARRLNRNRRIKKRMPRPLCWVLAVAACTAEVWVLVAYVATQPTRFPTEKISPAAAWVATKENNACLRGFKIGPAAGEKRRGR